MSRVSGMADLGAEDGALALLVPGPGWWRLVALLFLAMSATVAGDLPQAVPAQVEVTEQAKFVPTDEDIARYLVVLPALMHEIKAARAPDSASRTLSRETMARVAKAAGFDSLERFARTHLCVLAGYACLQAESMRADLAANLEGSPTKLVDSWRERIESLDVKIAVLRREVAPEALDKLRPLLPTLERLLTTSSPPASQP